MSIQNRLNELAIDSFEQKHRQRSQQQNNNNNLRLSSVFLLPTMIAKDHNDAETDTDNELPFSVVG
jgi:hypothetical protein